MSDAARDLHISIGFNGASALRGLDNLNSRVDGTRNNIAGVGSGLGQMGARFETQMDGLDKGFTLWERNSNQFTGTMERKQRRIDLVTDKTSLLEREIERTTGELIGVTREFGQGTEAAARLENQLLDLQIQQSDLNREMKSLTSFDWDRLDRIGDAFGRVGRSMSMYVTAPLVGIGALGVRTFVQLEDSWAGVEKVTNATAEELAFLRQEMNDLVTAGGVPLAVTDMYDIAQAAGRLGIEINNVRGFAETTAMLGTVTNMTAEQAANDMAQFATVMRMSGEQFDQLGATLVGLGNNMATTESDIMRFGARLTGAGSQIGLAESEVLGFAAAFSALGINAEAGGTAFTNVMLTMQDSIFKMDERLETFAFAAGKSVDEFTDLFERDAASAILYFTEGLGRLSNEGYNTNAIFEELGFNAVGVTDLLRRAANSGDTLRTSIGLANTSWEENSALTEAAGKRYGTTAAQMQVFRNTMTLFSETIGNDLSQMFGRLLNVGTRFFTWLNEMDAGKRRVIVTIAGVVAAIGPLLVGIDMGIKIFGRMRNAIKGISKGFTLVKGAFAKGGLAIKLFTNPVFLVILAIGALIAIGVALWKNWDNITSWLQERFPAAFGFLSGVIEGFRETVHGVFEGVKRIFGGVIDFFTGVFTLDFEMALGGLGNIFGGAFDIIISIVTGAFSNIFNLFDMLIEPLRERFPALFEFLSGTLGIFRDTVEGIIGGVKRIFGGIVDFIGGVFTGDWGRAWEGIRNVFGGIFETLGAILKAPINFVISAINTVIGAINRINITVPDWVPLIGGRSFGFNIPKIPMLAKGTDFHIGGPAIVGEKGPELVNLPRGSQVIPNRESMGILSRIGRASRPKGPDTYNINKSDDGGGIKQRFANIINQFEITIEKIIIGGEGGEVKQSAIDDLKRIFKDLFAEAWEEAWYELSLKYPNLTEA